MTFKQFKISTFLVLVTSIVFAQKYDKKFNENFKTNKDAVVTINASNATIDVTTWNKNEVSVEAVIEVEGLDKKAAEKYFKNWKFEALGNKNKVQINANNSNVHSFGNDNIVFFNSSKSNHPNIYQYNTEGSKVIVIPEIPEIEIPEMPELPEIVIPEINFEEIVSGLDHIEFDFDKYAKDGGTYFFQWKDGVNDITIKSKKEWEAFKKSKKYKKYKKAQEKRKIALKKELKEVRATLNKKELKREIAKARAEIKRVNRKEVRRELLKAREEIKRVRKEVKNVHYSYSIGSNNFMVDGKKVKVTKKLVIKVPKNATFDLNTRHCKVKLPKTKASGKVSYGTFKADVLNGGKLNISFSPVNINSLNACTVFLNNVTDAHVASVANTTLKANSSGLTIGVVRENTEIDSEFGELSINKVISDFNLLKIFLNYSNSTIKVSDLDTTISIDSKKGKFEYDDVIGYFNKTLKKRDLSVKFTHPSKTSKNKIILTANYSNIKLK
ncbi:hypothetical protein [Tenacibaculum ovolyticum]|uniref:hypothetical protein n=1 Tax=Tenacibaculum ovolyticum TaxID=104270 RepID=UPI0012F7FA36|nr:hypothetical protein [Tenacibaculum ovolyticum]